MSHFLCEQVSITIDIWASRQSNLFKTFPRTILLFAYEISSNVIFKMLPIVVKSCVGRTATFCKLLLFVLTVVIHLVTTYPLKKFEIS